jgi:DNA-binding MarR family transcriptional regulator
MDYGTAMTIDTDELELVAEVFAGLSNRSKIALLLGFDEEKSVREIADHLEMTQQGLERNLDKMLDAGLIVEDNDQRYRLTPIGEYFVQLLDEEWDTIVEAKQVEKEMEETARQRAEAGQEALQNEEGDGFTFQIDDNTWERIVQTQKWELAENDLNEILRSPTEENN